MNNNLLQLKIKQRCNKLSSNDYDSFECWMIVEAFNKVQNDWVSSEIGKAEMNTQSIDELQPIVVLSKLIGVNRSEFYEAPLPANYFGGNRISAKAVTDECQDARRLTVFDGEESNLDTLLRDSETNPNFEWAETFKTIADNKVKIHTDGKFQITEAFITYYRKPRQISFDNCVNEYDQATSDVTCEFKDDVTDRLIDKTAALLTGDTENFNQAQRLSNTLSK